MPAVTMPAPFTLTAVHQENYRTKTLVFDGVLDASPGQFVMAWLPRFDEKPFSLVDGNPITLMVTAVGPFSALLHALQPGDRLWLRGPFGHGFQAPTPQDCPAFVGGGYGVAPLLWLARSASQTPMTAIIGARTADDLLYVDRFAHLAGERAAGAPVTVLTSTEDGSHGARGLVTHVLEPLLAAGSVDSIYACGPHGMLLALASLGLRYAVPCQLSWEAYMRCGIGICGACEHDGRVLCLDGPVLAYSAGSSA